MLVVFSPIFVADTKIIFRYDFVASLNPRGRIRLTFKRNVKTKRWEKFV